jgi:hypothetical protein
MVPRCHYVASRSGAPQVLTPWTPPFVLLFLFEIIKNIIFFFKKKGPMTLLVLS